MFYFLEVGQHYYWNLLGYQVHGQVLINTWLVLVIIFTVGFSTTRELKLVSNIDILGVFFEYLFIDL